MIWNGTKKKTRRSELFRASPPIRVGVVPLWASEIGHAYECWVVRKSLSYNSESPRGPPEVSIWRRGATEGENDRYEGQKIGWWVTVLSTDSRGLFRRVRQLFAASEKKKGFFRFFFLFNVIGTCLIWDLFQKKVWLLKLSENQKVTRSNLRGMVDLCPRCSATALEWRNAFNLNIPFTPLAQRWTSSDDRPLFIISVFARRHSVFDYSCLGGWFGSDYWCCLVLSWWQEEWFFFCFWQGLSWGLICV